MCLYHILLNKWQTSYSSKNTSKINTKIEILKKISFDFYTIWPITKYMITNIAIHKY